MTNDKRTGRRKTWGDIFRASVRRGSDYGYAAFVADNWERRNKAEIRKTKVNK